MNLLTSREVAEKLHVCVATILHYTHRKVDPIPHYRFGRKCVRYEEREIETWARNHFISEEHKTEKLFDVPHDTDKE